MSQARPAQQDEHALLSLEARACWALARASDATERARLCFPEARPWEAAAGWEKEKEAVLMEGREQGQASGCPDDAVVLQNTLMELLKDPSAVATRSRLGIALRLAAMRLEDASLHTLAEFAHHMHHPPPETGAKHSGRDGGAEQSMQSSSGPFSQDEAVRQFYGKEQDPRTMRLEREACNRTGMDLDEECRGLSGLQNNEDTFAKGTCAGAAVNEPVSAWLAALPLLGRMEPTLPHISSSDSSIASLASHRQNQHHADMLKASLTNLDARAALSACRFALDAKLAASPHAPWTLAAAHAHLLHPPLPFPLQANQDGWATDDKEVWEGCTLHEEDSSNKNVLALIREAAASCHRRRDASLLQRTTRGFLLPTATQEMLKALQLRDASNGFEVAAFVARNASSLPLSSPTREEGNEGGNIDRTAKWMVEGRAWDACGRPFLSRLARLHALDAQERCSSSDSSALLSDGTARGNQGNGNISVHSFTEEAQKICVDRRSAWQKLRMDEASAYVRGLFDRVEGRGGVGDQVVSRVGMGWRNNWAKIALQDRLQGRGGTDWASRFGVMAHHARVADPNGRAEDAVRWMRTCEPHWKRHPGEFDARLDAWMAAALAGNPDLLKQDSLEAEKRAQMASEKLTASGDWLGARDALYVLAALRHARGDLRGRDEAASRFLTVDAQCQTQ